MDSPLHVPTSETAPFWTDEKHVRFLNTMEASFVRTMFENKKGASTTSSTLHRHRHHHHHHFLRLDRHLPDTSESTLDLKPHHRGCTKKHYAPSDSTGPTSRRRRRRSSQPCNSSQDQVVPQVESQREEGAACNGNGDETAEN